ncbi:ABC transporter ATP-binding protein [Saccharibacillus brassicae]|uniref:ABC transporter ATP-binding protein n=1 Tax=Saccharibacillus brassicae TaxID=2583377 RepID=A0A4Y6URG2_SACBS|nr:ATP-binding cassette domain-containing protein [Saccharibacillus brassicae]QDH20209.1 ABC transporter ATP-binding protein [Saccharibacillus brassicae]
MNVLEAVELTKVYEKRNGWNRGGARLNAPPAVSGLSLELRQGETLALVGESGCGKSTLARMLLKLEPPTAGRIRYRGTDITDWNFRQMREVRSRMQPVFQNSLASFDPAFTVEKIVGEPLRGARLERAAVVSRIAETLESVGLGSEYLRRYPSELSGGQQQRVGIARAIACEPEILVLDEPFSSLDYSLRKQAMRLLDGLKQRLGLSYLFITHDLSAVGTFCDRVSVMRRGEIVEQCPAAELQRGERHPYTRMLLDSIPVSHPALRNR